MKYNKNEERAYNKGYRIDDEGNVIGLSKENVGYTGSNGYKHFKFRIEGENYSCSAHRLQAYQKFGEQIYNSGTVVRHLDGDQNNNHIENIAIGSSSDNYMDQSPEVRKARAEHASSFVKKHDHEDIKKYHEKHGSYQKTMEYFNISSKGTLHFILKK